MAGPIDALLDAWSDAFGEQIADSTTNRLDASGTYTFNTGRHVFLDDGSFTFDIANTDALTEANGKFTVTAQAGETHVFGARELIRYVPTYELLWGAATWAESELQPGQHYAVEFSRDTFEDGYRYHYFNDGDGPQLHLEQVSGGVVVDADDAELSVLESSTEYDHTTPAVQRATVNWYGAGLARYGLSYPRREDGAIREQENPTIGRTANDADVATGDANQRVQVRVWADAGADPVTVNVCSLGAIVRGNATEVNREKPGNFWDVGGSISQYPSDNAADAIAARIDPERDNVVAKMEPPLFAPAGSGVTMELGVYAIQRDHPDLSVNFADPDGDGTDEGPAPAAQSRRQTDVMQYTRSVSSIPTATDIRADGTEGLVPNMRQLTVTVGSSGGGNTPASTTGGEGTQVRRTVYHDDVVIFLPRTDPTGNTTSGTVRWLKPLFKEDW